MIKVNKNIPNGGTGILRVGNSIYEYYYPDKDPIRKLTYFKDMLIDRTDIDITMRLAGSSYHTLFYIRQDVDRILDADSKDVY